MSFTEKLLEIKANAAQYLRPESQAVSDRTIAWLNSSGAAAKVLKVGQRAPEFALTAADGRLVSSDKLLMKRPALLLFFRGRWCPYCVAQLEALRDARPKFEKGGIASLAVSPQTLRQIDFMQEQYRLNFPLFRDERNRVAQAFGVAYEVPPEQQDLYRKSFVNLPFINGEDSWTLPMPSAFVLDGSGPIQFASVHTDFTQRVDPEMLLKVFADKVSQDTSVSAS